MEKITDNELETGMMEGLGTMKLEYNYGVSYKFWSLYALAFQFRGPHTQIPRVGKRFTSNTSCTKMGLAEGQILYKDDSPSELSTKKI